MTLTDAMMMAKPIEGLTFEIDQQGNTDDIVFAFEATSFENDSIRVKDSALIEQVEIPDVQLAFSVQGTDGDGDVTQVQTSRSGSTVTVMA